MTQGHRGFFASKPATVAQMYGQLISLLDKHEILKFSREKKGERYVKHFDEMHTNIHANEGVTSGIKFTSAATNDSFMLKPTNYNEGGHCCFRQGIYRLRQIRGNDKSRCDICYKDKEESCL